MSGDPMGETVSFLKNAESFFGQIPVEAGPKRVGSDRISIGVMAVGRRGLGSEKSVHEYCHIFHHRRGSCIMVGASTSRTWCWGRSLPCRPKAGREASVFTDASIHHI